MSNKLDQCRDRLKREIETVETNLSRAGNHVASAAETGIESLESHLKSSLDSWASGADHARETAGRVKQFLEDAKDNAVSRFEDWKTDREISRLEKDADEKEQRAAEAIAAAAFAVLEAEVAIVDALRARKIVVEVSG